MITITETLYKKMPDDIKACFNQLPNTSSDEVRECFPETKTNSTGKNSPADYQTKSVFGAGYKSGALPYKGDNGNASRFFKSIKQPYTYKGKEYEVEGFVKSCKPQAPSNYNDEGSPARYFKSIQIEEQDEIQEECTSMEEKLEKLGFLPEAAKSIIYQAKSSKRERNAGCEELYILKDNTPKEDIDEIKHLLSI